MRCGGFGVVVRNNSLNAKRSEQPGMAATEGTEHGFGDATIGKTPVVAADHVSSESETSSTSVWPRPACRLKLSTSSIPSKIDRS